MAIYEEICAAEAPKPPRPALPPSIDGDGDTWPDSVDCQPGIPNPDWDDRDGDGIPDVCDSCPCTSNPNQHDIDGDGNGDACDTTYSPPTPPGGTPPDGDEDGDGIPNDEDPCPCEASNTCDQCPIQLVELPIYGLGRVGVARPENVVITDPSNQGPVYERRLGEKFYELSDHLGSVRMVISDIKRSVLTGGVPGSFFADVHSTMNAYPYGMPMPGRWWDSALVNATTTYRYGFNGVESDAELGGQPHAHFSTLFRQYDPRVARWWSNDPIVHPWESPYAAMAGNPIALADPLGLDGSSPLQEETGGESFFGSIGNWISGAWNSIFGSDDRQPNVTVGPLTTHFEGLHGSGPQSGVDVLDAPAPTRTPQPVKPTLDRKPPIETIRDIKPDWWQRLRGSLLAFGRYATAATISAAAFINSLPAGEQRDYRILNVSQGQRLEELEVMRRMNELNGDRFTWSEADELELLKLRQLAGRGDQLLPEYVDQLAADRMAETEGIGILRDAATGKGNFGLGSATVAEANRLGQAWVGPGYTIASDGKTLVSKDELRTYRPPTWKPKLGRRQANFERREANTKTRSAIGNGHLDIVD